MQRLLLDQLAALMGAHFGGRTARKVIVRGEITCALQYVNKEEAACFYPTHRRGTGAGCYVICLSSAHKYADDKYLVQQSRVAAEFMGLSYRKDTVHAIAKFINDMLIELVTMKPLPKELEEDIGTVEDVNLGAHSGSIIIRGNARTLQ